MPSATDESFFDGGWQDDDERIDLYALFVLDDVPVAAIEEVIRRNLEDSNDSNLWLADDYNNLPDLPDFELNLGTLGATEAPLDPNWQSPFGGKTLQDAARYLRSVPKPRKPLCKTYFVVLDGTFYQKHDQVFVCKVLESGEVQSVPCEAARVSVYLGGHDRSYWDQDLDNWEDEGLAVMSND
ncbi:unnamed protein product [Zymoseptoria tritici ST99CH_1A5]|uniref:Uncharacterized protein n=1 Tax=Zymoseptoria tritici ST99CH_1A5 TaxID=1276529 RepID=A0A1Y6L974_ZYMTR|nr:unnamed protein product [Zymoseptoria tritici ST99CH_1A5]